MNVCVICQTAFTPKRHTTGKYCGRKCAWEARGGTEFNAMAARVSAAKRGDAQRGRGEGRTYRKLNGRHEHRVVAEQMLGRSLLRGEVVHHRDHNKLNNSPENLEVITQGKHMRRHGLGIPGVTPWWKPWTHRWTKESGDGIHV